MGIEDYFLTSFLRVFNYVVLALVIVVVFVIYFIGKRFFTKRNREYSAIVKTISTLFGSYVIVDVKNKTYKYVGQNKAGLKNKGLYEDYLDYRSSIINNEKDKLRFKNTFDLQNLIDELGQKEAFYDDYIVNISNKTIYETLCVVCVKRNRINEPTQMVITRQDVSRVKEQELIYQSELQKSIKEKSLASRAKSEFLSNMSHDIRTPLNAIIGMNELCILDIDDKNKIEDYTNQIRISAHHLLELINNILDITKIESGGIELDSKPFSITKSFKSVHTILDSKARNKNIKIQNEVNVIHDTIIGDKLRFRQVLMNLFVNAIKFTNNGGTITESIREVAILESGRIKYEYIIKDTGSGIDPAFLPYIFDPFKQALDNDTRSEGSGLGLAIVKSICDEMNANISVDTQIGVGTTFKIIFEFNPSNVKDESEKEDIKIFHFNDKKVLLVEDNVVNQMIAKELLLKAGVEVDVASDGTIALNMLLSSEPNTYDLVLMDIQMPNLNGYEATISIRRQARKDLKQIPIIAMTANAFSDDVKKALSCGMNAHLAKPIEVSKLYDLLTLWL